VINADSGSGISRLAPGEFRCFFERGEFKRFVSLVINFSNSTRHRSVMPASLTVIVAAVVAMAPVRAVVAAMIVVAVVGIIGVARVVIIVIVWIVIPWTVVDWERKR
jgi:hypothetical protein